MKKFVIPIAIIAGLIALWSCSTIFSASISGSLHDAEAYDANPDASGISDAVVYLYLDSTSMAADLEQYMNNNTLPEEGNGVDFFQSTVTDNNGSFTFTGFMWEDLNPDYGKSGDRREVWLLFHHHDYGLIRNPYPLLIISNVTNRLAPIKIEHALNKVKIIGRVMNKNVMESGSSGRQAPLGGVAVRVFVPDSWDYATDSSIVNSEYSDEPNYTFLTDGDGFFSGEIAFPMTPNSYENRGTCKIIAAYSLEDYAAYELADTNGEEHNPGNWICFEDHMKKNRDLNRNGWVERQEVHQEFLVDAFSETNLLPLVHMRKYSHSATVSGRTDDGSGIQVNFFWNTEADTSTSSSLAVASTTSYTRYPGDGSVAESGYFQFPETFVWHDYNYSSPLSSIQAVLTDSSGRLLFDLVEGSNYKEF